MSTASWATWRVTIRSALRCVVSGETESRRLMRRPARLVSSAHGVNANNSPRFERGKQESRTALALAADVAADRTYRSTRLIRRLLRFWMSPLASRPHRSITCRKRIVRCFVHDVVWFVITIAIWRIRQRFFVGCAGRSRFQFVIVFGTWLTGSRFIFLVQ